MYFMVNVFLHKVQDGQIFFPLQAKQQATSNGLSNVIQSSNTPPFPH